MKRLKFLIRPGPYLAVFLSGVLFWQVVIGAPAQAQETAGFKVIVNVSNPLSTTSRNHVARIFLKKEEKWESGFAITVVDQLTDHPARQAFSTAILRKEAPSVEAYWRKLIFSGMGSPPLKLASDAEVVTFVGNNVGSIGYVSDDTELGGAVKELEVTR